MCRPIVTYLRMSALHTVRLPPEANVPARHMRWTNAFAAARGDKMAMRPFAKLLWTFVIDWKPFLSSKQVSKHAMEPNSQQ